jgi:hypothetical protein
LLAITQLSLHKEGFALGLVKRSPSDQRGSGETRKQEEGSDECVEDWVGTVELAGTVTVPPLSVRIARCRVIRRGMVDTDSGCLPGVYMARLVATLEVYKSSSDARVSEPLVGKSPLAVSVSPSCVNIASSDGKNQITGSGETLPEEPEGGLLTLTTVKQSDLQTQCNSLPVESKVGNGVGTPQTFQAR